MTRSPPRHTPPAYTAADHTNGYEFTQGKGYVLPEYPFVPPPELTHAGPLRRHPVVIVGGGISGLTLACALARLGLPAVLLDEDNTVGVKGASSRGICYTQKSLEIFHRLGIYERIAAKGVQWSVGRTFAGDDEVYRFDLREQHSFNLSAQPPFINIQQFYIEGFLVERIQALGHVDMRWNNRLVAFEQTTDFATLTVDTPAGRYQIEADHVIDATGSASPLRKWLAVPFDSQRGDDRWCIADVRFNTHPPLERHTWIEAPFNDNRAVWQHLMADDVWRIDYQMAPDADPAYVSREDVVRERLARQFGPDVGVDIVWVGPYAYRSECVHHMRAGRVYFLGDSAKVVSPFGARGGNTGVSDADNLAWKLAAVLGGLAAPALLDAYHAERHSAAVENVRVTGRTARFLRAPDGMERLFRTAAISLARQQPFARALINTGRMAVANPYPHSPVCAADTGTSVQNAGFQWADHTAGCLNDLLGWSGVRLLLLVFTPHLSPALRKTLVTLTGLTPVSAVHVLPAALTTPPHQATEQVIDHLGHLGQACGMTTASETHHTPAKRSTSPHWALVRPDGYLVGRGQGLDGMLIDAIAQALAITPLDDPDTPA